jgi:hypothetical protein
VVRLRGRAANVTLLDATNFSAYRRRLPFFYHRGGNCAHSPVELDIPGDGHWYVVIDLGGYSGHVRASVEVLPPDDAPEGAPREQEATLVDQTVMS